jgi:hypothetical protein
MRFVFTFLSNIPEGLTIINQYYPMEVSMEVRFDGPVHIPPESSQETERPVGEGSRPAAPELAGQLRGSDQVIEYRAEGLAALIPGLEAAVVQPIGVSPAGGSMNGMSAVPLDIAGHTNATSDGMNQVKGQLREDIINLKDMLSNWPADLDKMAVTYHELVKQPDGTYGWAACTREMSKEELGTLVEALESQYSNLNELSELKPVNLEDMMQRENSILQAFEALIKMEHDLAVALVRKIDD